MARRTRHMLSDYLTLRRRSSLPVWADIAWRVLFVLGLIGTAVAVHWFDRNGLQDSYDGDVSFLDVIYFTMISITTTGYGDIAPVTERARMFDALVVTPIRIFVVLIFVGTAYNFVLKRTWDNWRMKLIQGNLHDHIVIAGFGTSGKEAVQELIARGTNPEDIVVIDPYDEALAAAEQLGCAVINGDATRDVVLLDVKISRARSMIVSAGRDDTSILIVLTARHLAYHLPISVSVKAADNELLARQAGATTVINPVSFAGLLLAGSCEGAKISDYLSDLASATGRVKLVQREVEQDEVGMAMNDVVKDGLGVRIYRGNDVYGFWEPQVQKLEEKDVIVEIIPGNGAPAESDEEKAATS
ncbi:voltage-gated potassium channel [Parasphingorhabdus marina DSM 22363]|uniref:Voltage-gated potassium channel n=1 Tax=Parasphingorhabdus marina DSM 22363 TaxID=1123272 RepID=A0A1N6D680_9SPHN|nr:potassium channel family protein [Parasphingorhabdus marina]SIN66164.1 voltage-gated potassium channel [Parasphingorhabdus marina DSM 22363]